MNIFIVYFHPEPKSFNSALLDTAVSTLTTAGHAVQVSNLYEMNFNPVSGRQNFTTIHDPDYFKQQLEEIHATEVQGFAEDIAREQDKLTWCDLMIWQFPLWWFGLPAPLKGWVDRVFAMGKTYGNGRFYRDGIFKGKKALLSLTTGGPREAYLHDGFNGDIMAILRPIQRGMLEFVGFSVLAPHIVWGPAHISNEERRLLLNRYTKRLQTIEKETAIDSGRYR
jgi:NAD(P)H dehydrogenase (quinone)